MAGASRPPLFHVLAAPRETGLANDQRIIEERLRASGVRTLRFPHPGYAPHSRRYRLERLLRPELWCGQYAANVFLEEIQAAWLERARCQVLVPNQEWLRERCRALLPRMDLVLCKTRHAEEIFGALGCRTVFTGFTSIDRLAANGNPLLPPLAHYSTPRPLHVAGKSETKGTRALLQAWRRHPEWPELTLLARPGLLAQLGGTLPANVRLIDRYLPDAELHAVFARHNIHLCPSESEGFGHTIAEALGCAAAVLSTAAPPMNELVAPERGVLVPAAHRLPMRSGTRFLVDPEALELAIDGLVHAGAEQRRAMGHAARRWFEHNDSRFRAALPAALALLR